MKSIALRVRPCLVVRGYTPGKREVVERIEDGAFAERLIAIGRIQSVREQDVPVTGAPGRLLPRA
jgi:hypothetical protein